MNKPLSKEELRQQALTLKFSTANEAFGNNETDLYEACSATLRAVASRVFDGEAYGNIRDVNGNTIGSFSLKTS